jgi:hypothetical protein
VCVRPPYTPRERCTRCTLALGGSLPRPAAAAGRPKGRASVLPTPQKGTYTIRTLGGLAKGKEEGMPSITDSKSSLQGNLETSPVTDDKQRLQQRLRCYLCSLPVTDDKNRLDYHPFSLPVTCFRSGSYSRIVCASCVDEFFARQPEGWWTLLGPCVHCGNLVYGAKSVVPTMLGPEAYDRWINSPVCSSHCNKLARLKRRKDERTAARAERPCEACNKLFVPTRADGKTCSNRCRQTMFREKERARLRPKGGRRSVIGGDV